MPRTRPLPVSDWTSLQPLPPGQPFHATRPEDVLFTVDSEGKWHFEQKGHTTMVTTLPWGKVPVRFQQGKPAYRAEWALALAVETKDSRTISRLVGLGAPLDARCPGLLEGDMALSALAGEARWGQAPARLGRLVETSLSRTRPAMDTWLLLISEMLALKQFGCAELFWQARPGAPDAEAQHLLLQAFLSPRVPFSEGYSLTRNDPHTPVSRQNGEGWRTFEAWMDELCALWLSRLPAPSPQGVPVHVQMLADGAPTRRIGFDPWGALLLVNGQPGAPWFERLARWMVDHLSPSPESWMCEWISGPVHGHYPDGVLSSAGVLRHSGLDEAAARLEQQMLSTLPSGRLERGPRRL
jgi:hypothetical protein